MYQSCTRTIRNSFFEDLLCLALFPIKISNAIQKFTFTRKIRAREKKKFLNQTTTENKLGTCRMLRADFDKKKYLSTSLD